MKPTCSPNRSSRSHETLNFLNHWRRFTLFLLNGVLAPFCCLTTAHADPTNGSSLRLDYVLNPADFGIDSHEFGGALCVDGNRIAVHQWTGNGVVHVFEGSPETGFTNRWSIPSPDTTFNSATFGGSLGFRGDFLYAGSSHTWRAAPHDGTAYLFNLTTGALKEKWTESPHAAEYFGRIGGIAEDLLFVCQGSNPSWGSRSGVFAYSLSPTGDRTPVWSLIQPASGIATQPAAATRDHLFARFTTVDAGVPGIVAFDVVRDASGNFTGIATNSTLADPNLYGEATSGMAASGDLLACGNPFFGDTPAPSGAVFIYRMSASNGLTRLAAIPAPSGLSNAQFGMDVKFVAGKLVVGAPGFVAPDGKRGCIYLYDFAPDGTPILQHRYQPSVWTFGNEELFGSGMAAAGDRLVVSSSGQDGSGVRGVVYFLSVTNTPPPAPPEITTHPQGVTVAAGSATTFTVTTTGTAPLAYQWRKDGLNLPGARNDTLSLINAQPVNIGDYGVVVSNAGGSVTSSNASLTIPGVPSELWRGLVAYYRFDNTVLDDAGHKLDLHDHDIAFDRDRFGEAETCVRLNGSTSMLLQERPFMDLAGDFAVSLWASFDDVALTHQGLFNSVPHNGVYFVYNHPPSNNRFRFQVGRGGWSIEDAGGIKTDFQPNTWYFLTFIKSRTSYQLLINGVLDSAYTLDIGPAPFIAGWHVGGIGDTFDSSGQTLKGRIDDLRIYNRAISASDVRQLYTLEASPCIPHPATAVATMVNGSVTDIQLTDLGCGYTNAPIVRIVGGGGTGATATTTIVNGYVTSITITSAGTGYTNAPRVRIASPPFMPSLSIAVSRVKVTQRVVLGRSYVLESSSDLQSWSLIGTRFTAEDELIEQEFEVGLTGRFFRIREVP